MEQVWMRGGVDTLKKSSFSVEMGFEGKDVNVKDGVNEEGLKGCI